MTCKSLLFTCLLCEMENYIIKVGGADTHIENSFFFPMGKVVTYVALVSWENFLWFHFKHDFLCNVCNL